MSDCFYYYHAGPAAVDTSRPWQLCCNATDSLIGQFSTWLEARAALDALVRDLHTKPAPVRTCAWEKTRLFDIAAT